MKAGVLWMTLLLLPGVSFADIIEWRDADGVSHYTNLKEAVPKDQRESAQVVVDELARRPQAAEQAAPEPPQTQAAEHRREAQVVYDHSAAADAYVAGMVQGVEAARAFSGGGSVQINGPLVSGGSGSGAPYDAFSPYHLPLVTTSFDRGRSRFRTLRLLLEDQFTIDREGPFIVESSPLFFPSQGIALSPFLARGLPPSTVPRQARVITR